MALLGQSDSVGEFELVFLGIIPKADPDHVLQAVLMSDAWGFLVAFDAGEGPDPAGVGLDDVESVQDPQPAEEDP